VNANGFSASLLLSSDYIKELFAKILMIKGAVNSCDELNCMDLISLVQAAVPFLKCP
jgi:hypothetical protein